MGSKMFTPSSAGSTPGDKPAIPWNPNRPGEISLSMALASLGTLGEEGGE